MADSTGSDTYDGDGVLDMLLRNGTGPDEEARRSEKWVLVGRYWAADGLHEARRRRRRRRGAE